jgi:hypothetical protein
MHRVGVVAIGHVPYSKTGVGRLRELVTLTENSPAAEAYSHKE